MYTDQIKSLNKLILIQQRNMLVNERSNNQPIAVLNLTLTEIQYERGR